MNLNISAIRVITKYAGKETKEKSKKIPAAKDNPPINISFLFFDAGEEIPFDDVVTYVKNNGEKALITLENGNINWEKLVLKTNQYGAGEPEPPENSLLYIADLNRDGTLAGNEKIKDMKNAERNVNNLDNFEAVLNKLRSMAFENNKLNFNLNPQFIKEPYTDKNIRSIIKESSIPEMLSINDFDNYYGIGTHRIRTMPSTSVPGTVQEPVLVGARYEVPSSADNFADKNIPFLGTKEQMSYLKEKVSEPQETKEVQTETPAKKEEEMEESKFQPVSEQSPSTQEQVKNKYASTKGKDSRIVELKEDDPSANYYTGDNSIMQDLVKRQHKKMKIRKQSFKVDADDGASVPISNDPEKNKETAEVLKNLAETQKQVKDKLQDIQRTTKIAQKTTSPYSAKSSPGAMGVSASTIKSVIFKYLKKS